MANQEFILCAAIDYNGVIICGHRHGDCYEVLEALVGKIDTNKLPNRDRQGFLTSTNRYVNRAEAWVIAKANDQIVYGLEVSDFDDTEVNAWLGIEGEVESILISENLY